MPAQSARRHTLEAPGRGSRAPWASATDSPDTRSTRSTPWVWIGAVAASFLGYFGLLVFCEISRPESIGIVADFSNRQMVLSDVVGGSPASRAGLRAGDRIVEAEGQPMRSRLDWLSINANLRLDRPLLVNVMRGQVPIQTTVAIQRVPRSHWRTLQGLTLLTVRCMQLVTLGFAIFVVFRRPHDPAARIGAWLLGSLAVISMVLPYRIADVCRSLPDLTIAFVAVPYASSVAVGALLFTFYATFPRPLFKSRSIWALVWTPMLVVVAWHLWYGYGLIYDPTRSSDIPDWSASVIGVNALYLVAGIWILVRNSARLKDANERRRAAVLVIGTVIGCASGAPVVAHYWLGPTANLAGSVFASRTVIVGTLLFLAFPMSFAYAILRHRLFDVSIMIRQGVRYALARGVVLSCAPAVAIVLAIDLLAHGDRTLIGLLQTRIGIYGAIVAFGVLAHVRRQQWLVSLDRRFFRERYNANQLLRHVAEEIRQAGDLERVAPGVVGQIEAALHPEFAAVLVCSTDEPYYRAVAIAPARPPTWALSSDSKLVALVRLLGKPLEISANESGWLRQQLPEQDTELLRESGIELLVPIDLRPGRAEALLALGQKRSEEPYTSDDYDLLGTIAEALGLLLDRRPPGVAAGDDSFPECPACGACYDSGSARCVEDGLPLVESLVPRVLAGRYRLEQRIGRGGMGSVYAAIDQSLERRVAVKVIRNDLVESAEALKRFHREARAAASFVHPNVVTVHDFGATTSTRAFLIMELLEGVTLRDELRIGGRLPLPHTLQILQGVCAAIDAAHGQGLVHRDLKPENIFLARSPQGEIAKVLDFGIAKAVKPEPQTHTGEGILLGTPQYMAPEQLRGGAVQPTWDLWAIAVTAYEMLNDVHPFESATAMTMDALALRAAGGFLTRGAGPTSSWDAFFVRALAIDPRQRPPSAATFFAELGEAVSR